jgi:hypothetical protein
MKLPHRIILIACSICVAITGIVVSKQRSILAAQSRVESNSLDTPWRLTADGWQDSRTWRDVQSESIPPEPGVHPIFWTLGVLLLAFGAMIWSSDEDDVEQAKKRGTSALGQSLPTPPPSTALGEGLPTPPHQSRP